jgi:hypothetical protein
VLLAVGAIAVVGLVIGATLRAPALLAASAAAAPAGVILGLAEHQPAFEALGLALACVAALAVGYLIGLFGWLGVRHLARRHR